MASYEAKKAIKRTNDILHALEELEKYKQRITDIQDAIEEGDFHAAQVADEIIRIGMKIQGLSKVLRKHSIEGKLKTKILELSKKFSADVKNHKDDKEWLKKYTTKHLLWSDIAYKVNTGRTSRIYRAATAAWLKENDSDA